MLRIHIFRLWQYSGPYVYILYLYLAWPQNCTLRSRVALQHGIGASIWTQSTCIGPLLMSERNPRIHVFWTECSSYLRVRVYVPYESKTPHPGAMQLCHTTSKPRYASCVTSTSCFRMIVSSQGPPSFSASCSKTLMWKMFVVEYLAVMLYARPCSVLCIRVAEVAIRGSCGLSSTFLSSVHVLSINRISTEQSRCVRSLLIVLTQGQPIDHIYFLPLLCYTCG